LGADREPSSEDLSNVIEACCEKTWSTQATRLHFHSAWDESKCCLNWLDELFHDSRWRTVCEEGPRLRLRRSHGGAWWVWVLSKFAGVLFNFVGVLLNFGGLFNLVGVQSNFAQVPVSWAFWKSFGCLKARLQLFGLPQGGGFLRFRSHPWCVSGCFGHPKSEDTISQPPRSWGSYLTSRGRILLCSSPSLLGVMGIVVSV
jgi:hypothetical protein